jgi:hypothetical protein
MFIVDKIHSIKCCELSSVVITIRGISWLGGCIHSLDSLIGVIPMLVFLVCRYEEN